MVNGYSPLVEYQQALWQGESLPQGQRRNQTKTKKSHSHDPEHDFGSFHW
jgi:hypothetical protein